MQLPRLFVVSMLVFGSLGAYAQTKDDFTGPLPKGQQSGVSEQVHQKGIFFHNHVKPYKIKRPKVIHTAEYEFYKRVERAAKEHQKALKKLYKPQYSNFLYYGHKRKPRKHSPDKMKYCPECGIRH